MRTLTLRRRAQTDATKPKLSFDAHEGTIHSRLLELDVVEHCNLSCRACSHLSPVAGKRVVDPEVLGRELALLAQCYRTRELRLLGGEPLLHPRLLDVLAVARESGIAQRLSLNTNGILLPRMPDAFWSMVDEVVISVYPGQGLSAADEAACFERARAAGARLRVRRVSEFRESYAELGTEDGELVQEIFATCAIRHCHTLADGHLYPCPQSYFIPKVLGHAGQDGIRIAGDDGFVERLFQLLSTETPHAACRNCLGTVGKRFPHTQVPRKDFRALQARTTEELLDARYLAKTAPSWRRALSLRS